MLSIQQRSILEHLAASGPAASIMDVRRYEWPFANRGHSASYARVHRLAKRGLVKLGSGLTRSVEITPKGRAAL